MAVVVQKYGGTSVGTVERVRAVAERVLRCQRAGTQVVVTVSAMAGETDRLLGLVAQLGANDPRERDVLLASGEQVSIALLAMAINAAGGRAQSFLAPQLRLLTDSAFTRARIQTLDHGALRQVIDRGVIPVIAGFQGVDARGNLTTLGRGGSDTSAVAIAACLAARPGEVLCEIYTDVEGVFTADPRICGDATLIRRTTYEEMMELASLGAKVLQIRAVEVASKFGVPLHVRSSFTEREGTMVVAAEMGLEQVAVTGVSLDRNQCRMTLRKLPLRIGLQAEIFRPLAEAGVVVDMIVQNPPTTDRYTDVSFSMPGDDLSRARELLTPRLTQLGAHTLVSDDRLAKVSIVGVGMRSQPGVAQRMFDLLAGEQIEIQMISTSEIKVSCLVPRDDGERAVRALHTGFGIGQPAAASVPRTG